MPILTPPGWIVDRLVHVTHVLGADALAPAHGTAQIRRMRLGDIGAALSLGWQDFLANRTDVLFLCLVYPIVGLFLGRALAGYDLLHVLFPMASGFALVGPVAALGLNEMSRRREAGLPVRWTDVFRVLRSPAIGAIAVFAAVLAGLFLFWLAAAHAIYVGTLGPVPPATVEGFLADIAGTAAGRNLFVAGIGVGAVFAVIALVLSVVTFPMLLDRKCDVTDAVLTSLRVTARNPVVVFAWGASVAALLAIGSLPLLLGLAVVLPWLGHATWHFYRRAVSWQ